VGVERRSAHQTPTPALPLITWGGEEEGLRNVLRKLIESEDINLPLMLRQFPFVPGQIRHGLADRDRHAVLLFIVDPMRLGVQRELLPLF